MSDAPERIWIDAFGGNWSPRGDGTQQYEYVRADLYRSLALDVVAAGGQASDAYEAQLKASAMAEKLAKEGANLFAEIDRSRGDIESPYVRVAFGMFQRALAEYEASK